MNPRDWMRLQHLADALNSAIRFARNRERGDLDTDEMLAFALVRTIEIARIADAVRSLSRCSRRCGGRIPFYCRLSQFSRRRPSIRANSLSLSVTMVYPSATA